VAGAVNGFLGTGGGMVLVPAFTRLVKMDRKTAMTTSVAVIAPLCLLSAAGYMMTGQLLREETLPYLAGGLFGGLAGAKLFPKISAVILRKVFAFLLIYGGVKCFF
jgi:uncharacterized membrane protein YfcA